MLNILIIILAMALVNLMALVFRGLYVLAIISNLVNLSLVIYLIIRVRIKMNRKEKENLKTKIEELEKKIESIIKKQ